MPRRNASGKTALMIMDKERFRPKRFEIGISGELSDETPQSESAFKSFHVSLQHRMRHRGRPGQSEPCGDAGARKVLRHDADAAQGRTRIARNRGGQHRACESLKRQARDKKTGIFRKNPRFLCPAGGNWRRRPEEAVSAMRFPQPEQASPPRRPAGQGLPAAAHCAVMRR